MSDQRQAIAELELWCDTWDDHVMENLDYVAATAAADEAIRTRNPSAAMNVNQGPPCAADARCDHHHKRGCPGDCWLNAAWASMQADYNRKWRGIGPGQIIEWQAG